MYDVSYKAAFNKFKKNFYAEGKFNYIGDKATSVQVETKHYA